MHNRKQYLIYPPGYKPGDDFAMRTSKRQAWKAAIRMGAGASVDVAVQRHRAARTPWVSSSGHPLWVVDAI